MPDEASAPDRKPTLENFLAGVPLNAEMEELAREVGDEHEPAAEPELPADPFDPLRPLDDADRKALQKLTQEPGWEVLTRIRRRTCAEAKETATLLSQENPLANSQAIAQGWAYLSVMRSVIQAEAATIEAELAKIRPKKKRTEQ